MSWIISTIVLAVPVMHLWLHALLPWWRQRPGRFYVWAGLLACGSLLLAKHWAAVSPQIFIPSGMAQMAGYLLVIFGAGLVLSSIITLGPRRFFLWAVFYPDAVPRVRIRSGVFKFFPHPAYLAYLLAALGNFLSNGQLYLLGLLIWATVLTPVVIYLEEQELSRRVNE